MNTRAAAAYKKVYLESAPPTRVLDELFARLQRDVDDARTLIAAGDRAGKGRAIDHAMAITAELSAALDFSQAPAMCANLQRLYDFVNDRLLDANVRIDVAPLGEAQAVIQTLREAFQAANERPVTP